MFDFLFLLFLGFLSYCLYIVVIIPYKKVKAHETERFSEYLNSLMSSKNSDLKRVAELMAEKKVVNPDLDKFKKVNKYGSIHLDDFKDL